MGFLLQSVSFLLLRLAKVLCEMHRAILNAVLPKDSIQGKKSSSDDY